MKVFTYNVPNLLVEKLDTLEEVDHHRWRGIYLQLHDKHERFNEMLRTNFINRALVDILEKDEGFIYFFDDSDIIVLFEGALKPIVNRLSLHFGDLDPEQLRGQSQDTLFSFFDLSKHWEGFAELCREKAIRITPVKERLPHFPVTARSDMVSV